MPVPLDKMKSPNQQTQRLHPSHVEKMVFVRYTPPPDGWSDRGSLDMWMERVAALGDDLHWLLQQPHAHFWCQVVFDDSLHRALDSFLRHCPRCKEQLAHLPEAARRRNMELCRLVFMVYLRMSTHKESKEHFITPAVFGDILYENFLFDIPKLLDISALYGRTNAALLTKMIGNIFTHQPKYFDDLRETIPTILQVFTNMAVRCGIQLDSASLIPQKLESSPGSAASLASLTSHDLQDLVLYLHDSSSTLCVFLEVCPQACALFQEFGFTSVIANFYDGVTPELTSALKDHKFPSESQKTSVTKTLQRAKRSILTIVHCVVNTVCLQPILDDAGDDLVVSACVEEFVQTMTAVLGERRFLAAYEGLFSFHQDVEMLMQTSTHIDSSQFDYIQGAINSAFSTYGRRKSPRGGTKAGGRTSPDGQADALSSGSQGTAATKAMKPLTADMEAGAGAMAMQVPRPSQVEVESLVSSVQDILPDLGHGFCEMCLEALGWDSESVVAILLDGNVPPGLEGVSRDLPRQERIGTRDTNQGDGQTDTTAENSILDSRRNVFDNDEFDVFRNRNVDKKKMHIGKKTIKVDLDDKQIVREMKATYEAYGNFDKEEGSIYDKENPYQNTPMYDDEYDDTYDSVDVGAGDADSADELNSKKTDIRLLPRVLQDLERKKAKGQRKEEVSDESGEEEAGPSQTGDFRPFVEDPAKLREQREQRWASQRGRGRGRGGPPRNRDVVGSAKGQGQSKEVQHNRLNKERHKGQRNRNAAAAKMSKGMF